MTDELEDGVPFEYADLYRLIDMVEDYWDDLGSFSLTPADGKVYVCVVDNDVFAWGYAGTISIRPDELDDLEQAYKDCHAIEEMGGIYGTRLWCCRKEGMRPQGAMYPSEREYWPLFDACGPEREVKGGNPYTPESYLEKLQKDRTSLPDRYRDRIMELTKLEKGWDGYSAGPISPDVAEKALHALEVLDSQMRGIPANVVPMANGGIQFEWYGKDYETILEVTPRLDEDMGFHVEKTP